MTNSAGTATSNAAILTLILPPAAPEVEITGVNVSGTGAETAVQVLFRYRDANGDTLAMSLQASSDNGASWDQVTVARVNGDQPVSATASWQSGALTWAAGVDWPGQYSNQMKVKVIADEYAPPGGMALIPAGEFDMGDTFAEGSPRDLPVHRVSISAVYMDKYEVTNEQVRAAFQWAYDQGGKVTATASTVRNVVGDQQDLLDLDDADCQLSFANGTFSVDSGRGSYACVEISWYGAAAYANFRSEMEGKPTCYDFTDWSCDFSKVGYRLPTEAEWEKAARGGLRGKRFPWGDTISHTQANYYSEDTFAYDVSPTRGYHPDYSGSAPYSSPVGAFAANAYGLYDMVGNVFEWCGDRWSNGWYGQAGATAADPTGPLSGSSRAMRGASWNYSAYACRAANRDYGNPAGSNHLIGCRLALPAGQPRLQSKQEGASRPGESSWVPAEKPGPKSAASSQTTTLLPTAGVAATAESQYGPFALNTRAALEVEITGVNVSGTNAETAVQVLFRYRAADAGTLAMSLQASSDNGTSWDQVTVVTVSGDQSVSATASWQSGALTWAAGVDWPGQYSNQMKVKVIADNYEPRPKWAASSQTTALLPTAGVAATAESQYGPFTLYTRAAATPEVEITGVDVSGTGAETAVQVLFRYRDADARTLAIPLQASSDNGASWDRVTVVTVGGDLWVNATADWQSGALTWIAGADWRRQYSNQMKVKVIADEYAPPPGMALIPAGEFDMGDAFAEGHGRELPVHRVSISAFYMDKYQVTNEQVRAAFQWALGQGKVTATASTVRNVAGSQQELLDLDDRDYQLSFANGTFSVESGKGSYPRVEITWYGAAAYANFRSEMEGKAACYDFANWSCDFSRAGYRLPTEAEWEKAARGGLSGKRFPWGDTISHTQANYYSLSSYNYDVSPTRGYHPDYNGVAPYSSPVGAFAANAYGLYDMVGNVFEWCGDRWSNGWYGQAGATAADPTGPLSGSSRAMRGASWNYSAYACRAANRDYGNPAGSNHLIGCRLALPAGQPRLQSKQEGASRPGESSWVPAEKPGPNWAASSQTTTLPPTAGVAATAESQYGPFTLDTHAAPEVEITGVSVSGTSAETAVQVLFRYRDADGGTLAMSLQASSDNGANWDRVTVVTVNGDQSVSATASWQSGALTWAAGVDWPGQYSNQMKVKVIADDYEPRPKWAASSQTTTLLPTAGVAATGESQYGPFTLYTRAAAAPEVEITGVNVSGTSAETAVQVLFRYRDADAGTLAMSLQASSDNGASWDQVTVVTVGGDLWVSATAEWQSGALTWIAGADWRRQYSDQMKIKLIVDGAGPPRGMALIPAGEFDMGDALAEGLPRELPVHRVSISAFYMDKYQVTNEQVRAAFQWALAQGKITATASTVRNVAGNQQELLDLDGSDCQLSFANGTFSVDSGKGSYPCAEITWYGAAAYANFRSGMAGKPTCYDFTDWSCEFSKVGYRLPTEAEWEKAARGGLSGKRFPWGDTISHTQANYYSPSSSYGDVNPTRGYHPAYNTGTYPYTSPVGAFAANAYGLYDMAGNVWEWCGDWYSESWYSQGGATAADPTGPASGSNRVLHAGGWSSGAYFCRTARRSPVSPRYSAHNVGCRLALPAGQPRLQSKQEGASRPGESSWVPAEKPGPKWAASSQTTTLLPTEGVAATAESQYGPFTLDTRAVPQDVTARPLAGFGKIVLKWNAVAGATGYKIYYDDETNDPLGPPARDGKPASGSDVGNVTKVTIRGLKPGRRHYLAVAAYDGGGTEPKSTVATSRAGDIVKAWIIGPAEVRRGGRYAYVLKLKWNNGATTKAKSRAKWRLNRAGLRRAAIGRTSGKLYVKRSASLGWFRVFAKYCGKSYSEPKRVKVVAGSSARGAEFVDGDDPAEGLSTTPILLYRLSSRLTRLEDGRHVQRRGGRLFVDPVAGQYSAVVIWRDGEGGRFYQRQDWHDSNLADYTVDGPEDGNVQVLAALERDGESLALRRMQGSARELTLADVSLDAVRVYRGRELALDAVRASYATGPLLARLDGRTTRAMAEAGTDFETAIDDFLAGLADRGFEEAPAAQPRRQVAPPPVEDLILVYRQSRRSAIVGDGARLAGRRGGFLIVEPGSDLVTSITTWTDAQNTRFYSRRAWGSGADLLLNYDVDAGRRALHILGALASTADAEALTDFDLVDLKGALPRSGGPARTLRGRLQSGSDLGDAASPYPYIGSGSIGARLDGRRTRTATATGDHAQAVADIIRWLEDARGFVAE